MAREEKQLAEISAVIVGTFNHCIEVQSGNRSFYLGRQNVHKKLYDQHGHVCGMLVPLWVANRYGLTHSIVTSISNVNTKATS